MAGMQVYKPLQRTFVPRKKVESTLALPENEQQPAPTEVDAEVVELHGDDGWHEWQDSVLVDEFTNEALQTVPGELK